MLVSDNPTAEGGLEGSAQLADNCVQLLEAAATPGSNSSWQTMQSNPGRLSDAFPKANFNGSSGIEFGSIATSGVQPSYAQKLCFE